MQCMCDAGPALGETPVPISTFDECKCTCMADYEASGMTESDSETFCTDMIQTYRRQAGGQE